MNKSNIIKHGIFTYLHGCYHFTINYPHATIVGYDTAGRQLKAVETKKHTFYGMFKSQCITLANQFLNNEEWEASHQVKAGYGTPLQMGVRK